MIKVIVEPYRNFKERINIAKKLNHLGQKYSDLGGFVYYVKDDGIQEELTSTKLCWLERNNLKIFYES